MRLYHGTSEAAAREAVERGLLPRGERKSNWNVSSREDLVYLTLAYAGYFAANASGEYERWGIIEVEVDQDDLLPDEDFLEQASCKSDVCPVSGMEERTAWFRDNLHTFAHHWDISLAGIGNAAHIGPIARDQIVRVVLFDPTKAPAVAVAAIDPMISILNFRIFGSKYKAITLALAGYKIEPKEFAGDVFWEMYGEDERKRNREAVKELPKAIEKIL